MGSGPDPETDGRLRPSHARPPRVLLPRRFDRDALLSVASLCRCKFARGFEVPGVSLCGGDLLVEGVGVGLLVFDSVEVLAVDVGEGGAVAGVAEEQVEHGPDE